MACSPLDCLALKLRILSEGIHVSTEASAALAMNSGLIASDDYSTTSGLPLGLGCDYYVNAPFRERFVVDPTFTLNVRGTGFVLSNDHEDHVVAVFPLPSYHGQAASSGIPFSRIINTHTDRARINPVEGCALRCDFCDAPARSRYRLNTVGDICEAVAVAIRDPRHPARHILVSGGTPAKQDELNVEEIYEAVADKSSVPVDVMMSPRDDLGCVDRLHAYGINDLFVNVEGGDSVLAKRIMKGKAEIGLQGYGAFLERAVKCFGIGRVLSLIVVGIEEAKFSIDICRFLCERGVIPVLSPFRPARFTPYEASRPPASDFLLSVLNACEEIASKYGLFLGPKCKACNHNTLNRPESDTRYIEY